MKQVYEWVRNSPVWNSTLLIITYDEHGGFYDHYPTPLQNVPSPDGIPSTNDPFNFTRLGVRVPTLLISPWINKGVVIGDPEGPTPYSHYEHSSILSTLKQLWNLPNFLTAR
jgi:phospholipase C